MFLLALVLVGYGPRWRRVGSGVLKIDTRRLFSSRTSLNRVGWNGGFDFFCVKWHLKPYLLILLLRQAVAEHTYTDSTKEN